MLTAMFVNVAAGQNTITTVDSTNEVGFDTSTVVANTFPAIAYFDQTDRRLKYIQASATNGTAWANSAIDPAPVVSSYVGRGLSMSIIGSNPAIAFSGDNGGGNTELWYVRASDADGSAWGSIVDVEDTICAVKGLTTISSNPAIAFCDETDQHLKFIRADSVDGSTWGVGSVSVDVTAGRGLDARLIDVGGNPAISYKINEATHDLLYQRATAADGSTWPGAGSAITIVSMGVTTYVGFGHSLLMVNGRPAACWFELDASTGTSTLSYLRADDAAGAAWTGTPVDIFTETGIQNHTFMAIINSNPAIAYYGGPAGAQDLMIVYADDVDGAAWSSAPVSLDGTPGDIGQYPSMIAITTGAGIAYMDEDNKDLRFIHVP